MSFRHLGTAWKLVRPADLSTMRVSSTCLFIVPLLLPYVCTLSFPKSIVRSQAVAT